VVVRRRTSPGGGGPGPVGVQLAAFDEALAALRIRVDATA